MEKQSALDCFLRDSAARKHDPAAFGAGERQTVFSCFVREHPERLIVGYSIRNLSAVPPAREKVVAVGRVSARLLFELHIEPRQFEFKPEFRERAGLFPAEAKLYDANLLRVPATGGFIVPSIRQAGELKIEPWSRIRHRDISHSWNRLFDSVRITI